MRPTPVEREHEALQEVADTKMIKDLIALRKRKRMRQADVAQVMCVDGSAVSHFERGKDPRMSTVRRYAAAIGASITHVITFRSDQ